MADSVPIPALAYEHAREAGQLPFDLPMRRRGRGHQADVPANLVTDDLAGWFIQEADFWSGPGVDPASTWRARPCRVAGERIRNAVSADIASPP